jgi:hypothetical protein
MHISSCIGHNAKGLVHRPVSFGICRFHRDEKARIRDPRVFVDHGREMLSVETKLRLVSQLVHPNNSDGFKH